jgi:Ca-activated chloride channel family protein
MSFEFQHPFFALWGILGLCFWLISFFYWFRKPQLSIPIKYKNKGFSFLRTLTFFIGVTGWLYLSFALAGPRRPMGMDKNTIEVNDIFIVLDLSRSMLADDLKPNRFVVAKQQVQEFVSLFPKDRIGVVIFAEKVFTLVPISTDLNLINKMVAKLELGSFLGDGTNIGDAIALAVGRLIQSQAKSKVIILITDGVSNVGMLTPIQAAEMAKENKIKIHTVGIGTDKDAKIPIGSNVFGTQRFQPIPGGNIDFKGLQTLAAMTGGKSFLAGNNKALENILAEINKLERTEVEQSGRIIYEELYFKYLLIAAWLIISSEVARRLILKEGP